MGSSSNSSYKIPISITIPTKKLVISISLLFKARSSEDVFGEGAEKKAEVGEGEEIIVIGEEIPEGQPIALDSEDCSTEGEDDSPIAGMCTIMKLMKPPEVFHYIGICFILGEFYMIDFTFYDLAFMFMRGGRS